MRRFLFFAIALVALSTVAYAKLENDVDPDDLTAPVAKIAEDLPPGAAMPVAPAAPLIGNIPLPIMISFLAFFVILIIVAFIIMFVNLKSPL